jgi:hypothetical protein
MSLRQQKKYMRFFTRDVSTIEISQHINLTHAWSVREERDHGEDTVSSRLTNFELPSESKYPRQTHTWSAREDTDHGEDTVSLRLTNFEGTQ